MYYPWAKANLSTKRIIFFKLIRLYNHFTSNKSAHLIRKEFLDYFTKNLNHSIIRSSPVSPITDPSLAFTNAGMNQVCFLIIINLSLSEFKEYFLKYM